MGPDHTGPWAFRILRTEMQFVHPTGETVLVDDVDLWISKLFCTTRWKWPKERSGHVEVSLAVLFLGLLGGQNERLLITAAQ
jgi:hypothetical protein